MSTSPPRICDSSRPDPDGDAHAEDYRLVRAALDRDRGAIGTLVERMDCVVRILHAINERAAVSLPRTEIEDLAQNTALVAWKKLHTFEGRARLESWVYRIAYLEYMNAYRKYRRERPAAEDDDGLRASIEAPARPDLAEVEEIERAVETLEPPMPVILRMKHHQGLTFRDIGARLELSPNSAKTYYYRGIDVLRQRFAPDRKSRPKNGSPGESASSTRGKEA